MPRIIVRARRPIHLQHGWVWIGFRSRDLCRVIRASSCGQKRVFAPGSVSNFALIQASFLLLITCVTASTSSAVASKALRKAQTFCWIIWSFIAASFLLIAVGLWHWGAAEVRGHLDQVLLLTLFGVLWMVVSLHLFPWLGLCIADDVVERRNPAALISVSAATLAVALTYASGSFGEGPSYWNNTFSAALATGAWFILWALLEWYGGVSISIAEERDQASGIRLGGFLLATALILGRAVAGDWHSVSATEHDFMRDGWPATALCLVAAILEQFLRPSRRLPAPPWLSYGLIPASVYLVIAILWLCHLGRWEGMPS